MKKFLVGLLVLYFGSLFSLKPHLKLVLSVINNQEDQVIEYLYQGANVDCVLSYLATPLMLAADRSYDNIIKKLLENGAKIASKAIDGSTAISLSQKHANQDMVGFLNDILDVDNNNAKFTNKAIDRQEVIIKRWIKQTRILQTAVIYNWLQANVTSNLLKFYFTGDKLFMSYLKIFLQKYPNDKNLNLISEFLSN